MWVLKISAWLLQAPEDLLHTRTHRWTQEILRGVHELGREEWSSGIREELGEEGLGVNLIKTQYIHACSQTRKINAWFRRTS